MTPLLAHPPQGYVELARRWTWDPLVMATLIVSLASYVCGTRRIWARAGVLRGVRPWQVSSFAVGWLSLVLALVSPLDALSDALFAAHMTQHEILILVAAPLIVAGRPLVPMLWALPARGRDAVGRLVEHVSLRRLWSFFTAPLPAVVVHGLVVWIWHVPALFQAALRYEPLHALQHSSFFVTAALFWWSMVHGRFGRAGYGLSVLFVFATALHTSILGALFSVGQRLWYPESARHTREWGLSPLEDQALAGLIMWIPSGVLFVIIGVALFVAWLGEAERQTRRRTASSS